MRLFMFCIVIMPMFVWFAALLSVTLFPFAVFLSWLDGDEYPVSTAWQFAVAEMMGDVWATRPS